MPVLSPLHYPYYPDVHYTHTVPLKCKLPPSYGARLISLKMSLVSLKASLIPLKMCLVSFEFFLVSGGSFLISRECTVSTNGLHCSNTMPVFEYNDIPVSVEYYKLAFVNASKVDLHNVVRLRHDHPSI